MTTVRPGAGRGPHGTLVIGLTGPIGCGKSTVARWLRELGARIIDADVLAREVVAPGQPALASVLDAFGPEVRAPDGGLDRAALARIVFADPEALRRLEAIIHPAVRPRILAGIAAARDAGAPAVVVEAIKLVEGGVAALCDEVWLITCSAETQASRIVARGSTTADAAARMAAQADLADRIGSKATRTIDTTGNASDARERVVAGWHAARDAAEDRGGGGRRPAGTPSQA